MSKHTDFLTTLANLLAKAERTDNEHERDAFMSRAQNLAARHSIDLAVARAVTAKAEQREEVEEQTVIIGARGQRGLTEAVRLMSAISESNDCRIFIAHDSTAVYLIGFPSDIEVCRVLFASLLVQMTESANRWVKSAERKALGVHGATARKNFQSAFVSTIRTRLWEARNEAEQAAVEDEAKNLPVSTALALVEKREAVDLYRESYIRRCKVRGSWRGSNGGRYDAVSARQGRAAGERARLTDRRAPAGIGA